MQRAEVTDLMAELRAEEQSFYVQEYCDGKKYFQMPSEFDQRLNDVSRAKIRLYLTVNENCFLGDINKRDNGQILRSYSGEFVYNFSADFIVPAHDAELIQLIERWRTKSNIATLDAIYDRIEALNGETLNWV